MIIRNDLSIKAEAVGLLLGIDKEWEEYLLELVESVDPKKLTLDWENAFYPLPKQLRNPSVVKEYKDGVREYLSSQLWLKLNKQGEKELLVPDETSGILLEGETGKVLKPFNGLPMITPENTDYLIRIHIQEKPHPKEGSVLDMSWRLYTNNINLI